MSSNTKQELLSLIPPTLPNPIGELERVTQRAIVRKNGSPNIVAQAELMYDIVFGDSSTDISVISENNIHQAEDLVKVAKAKEVLIKSGVIPSKADFVASFKHQITHTPINEAIFSGSLEAVETLATLGILCIWTSGDTHGTDLSTGSAEQYKRIVRAGLSPSHFRGQKENIFAHSHEDKISSLSPTILRFIERGVKNIVIVDDRLGNLIKAREFIATNFPDDYPLDEITLVWDQESVIGKDTKTTKAPKGFGGDPVQEATEHGVILVSSISDVCQIAKNIPNPGFLVDLDDVLIAEDKTTELRMKAVSEWFISQGWTSEPTNLQ